MRYLITGFNGQLGLDVARELEFRGETDYLALTRKDMDISNSAEVTNIMMKYRPDVVIHCAAYTKVDMAEDDRENAIKGNVIGTKNIAELCERLGSKLIYVSTDYVFDGNLPLGETYDVTSKTNPQSVYGKTKLEGEKEALKAGKCFVVRTSWVFGLGGNGNFIKTMLKLSDKYDEINVVSDQYGSPTYTTDLAKLLVDMSKTSKYGIYHASNEGFTSWANFAEEIFNTFDKNVKVNHITTEEYPTKARRPKNSCMSKDCLPKNGFDRLPDWKDALQRYKKELDEFNYSKKLVNNQRNS